MRRIRRSILQGNERGGIDKEVPVVEGGWVIQIKDGEEDNGLSMMKIMMELIFFISCNPPPPRCCYYLRPTPNLQTT